MRYEGSWLKHQQVINLIQNQWSR